MIGLLVLGHLVLVIISLVVCTLSLLSIIRKRRNAKNITAFSIAALAFIVLTWEHLVGLGIYKVQCALFSGLQINKPAHAINEGYLLKDSKNWGSGHGYNGYVSRAVEDLTTGRIGYFEVYDSHSDQ